MSEVLLTDSLELLKRVEFFQNVPPALLKEVSSRLSLSIKSDNQRVVTKGEKGDAMYFIRSGRVKVHDDASIYAELEAGELFGEMALLDAMPRSASVTTLEPSLLYKLKKTDFYEIVSGNAAALQGIIQLLARRMRQSNERIAATARAREAELKEHAAQLELARKRAEEANNAKTEFLAHMSHDLRNPLNAVSGCASLLGQTKLDARQLHLNNLIKSGAQNLSDKISKILEYSRLQDGSYPVQHVDFNLNALLTDSTRIFLHEAEQRNIAFEYIVESNDPLPVFRGDPLMLKRIVENLLSNAFKYTREGKVVFKLANLGGENGVVMLQLEIIDTGVGIDQEKLDDIFRPFFQLDATTTKEFQGVGLGLNITRQFLKLMGGEISVTSEPGKGSKFICKIPLGLGDSDGVVAREPVRDVQSIRLASLGPKSVLIVEDEEANSAYLYHLFTKLDWKAHTAFNGEQALKQLFKHQYDVVLMDGALPKLDGLEVVRRFREWEAENRADTSPTPILATTAYAFDQDRQKFLDAGASDYISKPIDERLLLEKIFRLVSANASQTASSSA